MHQEDQLATAMRSVQPDQRDLFLRNFETLISLPLPFDVAVRAAVWSVQEQERPNYEGCSGGKSESPKMLHGL